MYIQYQYELEPYRLYRLSCGRLLRRPQCIHHSWKTLSSNRRSRDRPTKEESHRFTNIGQLCIYPAVPTEYSLHEATLDSNPKRKPKSRRKRDYKGKKAASKSNEGIVVKGPEIKARGEASKSCSNSVENTLSEYCTNETTLADVNKFGDKGDPTPTHLELELRGVSATSHGRSVTAASRPHES